MVRRATLARVVLLAGLAMIPLTACVAEPYPVYSQPTYAAPYYGPYYAAPAPVYRPYSYYSFSYRSGPPSYYHRHHRSEWWRNDHRHWR
ncbi:MAG: hypothetical protein ACM30I_00865 [Gemmatimonas sp.]